jgi:hypothetical protein
MKKSIRSIFIVALSILMVLALAFPASGASYNDTSGHWAEETIETWAGKSLIAGYPGGLFNPNSYITRAEVAAILSRFDFTGLRPEKTFTDNAQSAWYYDEVRSASASGLIDGYPEGTFLPNANITRQEAFKIAATSLPKTNVDSVVLTYTDKESIADWASVYAKTLFSYNMLEGYPDGSIRGRQNITRAEFITLFSFLLGYADISVISANISGWIGTTVPPTATSAPPATVSTSTPGSPATTSTSRSPATTSTSSPPATTSTSRSSATTSTSSPSASSTTTTTSPSGTSPTPSTTGETYRVSMSINETTSGGERVILSNFTDPYASSNALIDTFFISAAMQNYETLRAGFSDDESAKEIVKAAAAAYASGESAWKNYVDQYISSVGQSGGSSVNLKTALEESKPLSYLGVGTFSFQYNVQQPSGSTRQYTTTITIAK